MQLGTFLDIAIGLAFVYVLLSLLASAINEFVASILSWRAQHLEEGIRTLLHDPKGNDLAKRLYGHPLIKGLGRHRGRKSSNPSYIPARLFATALLDVISPETKTLEGVRDSIAKIENKETRRSLLTLLDQAGKGIEDYQASIENWFNDTMDRVSGWYKRKAQLSLFSISALITLVLYANTISISQTLYRDRTLREALVAATLDTRQRLAVDVEPSSATGPAGTRESLAEIQATLDDMLPLPLGWQGWPSGPEAWFIAITGLLVTVIAVSLGAPFWFDVLNKLSNLRAAGKRPEDG